MVTGWRLRDEKTHKLEVKERVNLASAINLGPRKDENGDSHSNVVAAPGQVS